MFVENGLGKNALALGAPPKAFCSERRERKNERKRSADRTELQYILEPQSVMGEDYPSETFRVLKEGEIAKYGEYRTQRLVLEAWDRME